jgi:hypothetical protein
MLSYFTPLSTHFVQVSRLHASASSLHRQFFKVRHYRQQCLAHKPSLVVLPMIEMATPDGFCAATTLIAELNARLGNGQSDKIWRIDLRDDHEPCHPVGLRMTLTFLTWPWNPEDDPYNPAILSYSRSTGQYDQIISCHSGNGEVLAVHRKGGVGRAGLVVRAYALHLSAQPEPCKPEVTQQMQRKMLTLS